jgi:hypothetical protein
MNCNIRSIQTVRYAVIEDQMMNIFHVYEDGKVMKLDFESLQWIEISRSVKSEYVDQIRDAGLKALNEYTSEQEIELTKARVEILRLREAIKEHIHFSDMIVDEMKRGPLW